MLDALLLTADDAALHLARQVRAARRRRGWTQRQLADEARVGLATVARLERTGAAQLGSFLHEWWPAVPAPLEIAGRIALVDPALGRDNDLNSEVTLAANWFFEGHRNKLSVDVSRLKDDVQYPNGQKTRLRLQWEISL